MYQLIYMFELEINLSKWLNKWCFSCDLKLLMVLEDRMERGRAFHNLGAQHENARSPYRVLVLGMFNKNSLLSLLLRASIMYRGAEFR